MNNWQTKELGEICKLIVFQLSLRRSDAVGQFIEIIF